MTDAAGDTEGSFAARRCDDPAAAGYEVASVTDGGRRSEDRVRRGADDHERSGDNRIDDRGHSQVKRVHGDARDLALDRTHLLINGHEPATEQRNGLVRQPAYRDAQSIDCESMY